MGLRVFIICAKCQRQIEIHMGGGWDIKGVKHDCDATRAFDVTYDPPRQVF